ncbi:hypothetical protein DXG03_007049 [Asterophora parasitica]|uniref:Uncharacterized protein n=1 Tax=Asterophora parasitica TaxID=117018 RepID=A0A9P7KGP9_9AGAR|nr:hypothetical protein DXG03_007049 [Asterophora parasitica]
MISRPEPLLSTAISLVLEYIAPPSLLSPLPPHLISSALTQRHRFLHLSPDAPADYLVWPTDSQPNAQQAAVDLLEAFQKPVDEHEYPVRYTSDEESVFAHVAISSAEQPGIRMVFQWEPPDGWKFHNLALMPFPPNSYRSVNDAIIYEPHDFLPEPPIVSVDDDERDSYWDAYGLSDDDQPALVKPKSEFEAGSEDAYWAQYSSVHGSGDSARPTPPTVNQKLAEERVILAYPGIRTSSAYNPLEPPSPNTLAYRLANISPRAPSPPFIDDSDSGSGSNSGSGSDRGSSPTASPPSHTSIFSSDFPSSLLSIDTHTPVSEIGFELSPLTEQPLRDTDESRDALKDTIRSIYRLWRAGRVIGSPTLDGDKQEFLELVREVVAESSL